MPKNGQTISAEFPFESKFVDVHDSKIHYIDEGAGDPILFLHGNPTSSYLWRNIIPFLQPLGRCIAPDLIGMGKSDKPDIDYKFFDHVKYIEGFIEKLDLKNITFVIHDWGSALGFHYAMRNEMNVRGLAFMEAILMPIPDLQSMPADYREMFQQFRAIDVGWELIVTQNIFIEQVLPGATVRTLSDDEMNYYRQPFLEPSSRKPLWRWPNEIPIAGNPKDVTEAVMQYHAKLLQSELPKLLIYATPGAIITEPVVDQCRRSFRNFKSVNIGQGIHYLQEDNPARIGFELAQWYNTL